MSKLAVVPRRSPDTDLSILRVLISSVCSYRAEERAAYDQAREAKDQADDLEAEARSVFEAMLKG